LWSHGLLRVSLCHVLPCLLSSPSHLVIWLLVNLSHLPPHPTPFSLAVFVVLGLFVIDVHPFSELWPVLCLFLLYLDLFESCICSPFHNHSVTRDGSYFTICCNYFPTFSQAVLFSRGKSFIPPLAQRHWFHLRNWKIIKSSFCLLCVCCKALASPYAFQIYLHTVESDVDSRTMIRSVIFEKKKKKGT